MRLGVIVSSYLSKLVQGCWNIGFITNTLESVLNGEDVKFLWMKHNRRGSWFADPFILDVTDTDIIVLAEEYVKKEKKGRISKLTIDKKSRRLKRIEPVLSLPHHLSFPIIRRNECREVFIYPEASESGVLTEYKLSPEGITNSDYSRVLCNDAIVDAVVSCVKGQDFMLATSLPDYNGNKLDYYERGGADELFIKKLTFSFDENVARNAGDMFSFRGKTYRPAQECDYSYGHSVVLQELRFENGIPSFHEVRRLFASSPQNQRVGLHTFNIFSDLIVVDKRWNKRQWLVDTIDFIVKTKNKITHL